MVFVTVGNATQGFKRLLEAVDRLAGEAFFAGETVLIQSGNNPDFRPLNCTYMPFFSMEEFQARIHEVNLIISHAGAGTLFHVIQAGKIPIVMPRQKQYREHVDDHQVELAKTLAAEGRVIPAYAPEDLPTAIIEARRRNLQKRPLLLSPSRMITLVAKAIEEVTGHKA